MSLGLRCCSGVDCGGAARTVWFCRFPQSSSCSCIACPVGVVGRRRRSQQGDRGASELVQADGGKWRQRFVEHRLQGIYDSFAQAPALGLRRAGRRAVAPDPQAEAPGSNPLERSARRGGERLSKSTVHRVFQLFSLQPHRSKNFKLSTDPFFVEKVRDVVGLYLNPPDHAVVLSVDEKSQIQALNRTQPVLRWASLCRRRDPRLCPPRHHDALCRTRHRYRHGAHRVQAAPSASGVSGLSRAHRPGGAGSARRPSHRRQLLHPQSTPRCVSGCGKARFHVHYTPTYSSWLNQVERLFGLITQQAIRRGSFKSVKDLIAKINRFTQNYNRNSRPFAWTATADSIFKKLAKLCTRISGTEH